VEAVVYSFHLTMVTVQGIWLWDWLSSLLLASHICPWMSMNARLPPEGFFLNKYLSFQSPVDIIPAITKLLSSDPDNWEPAAIELGEKVLELIRPSEGNSVK
jgi:hypothetical protein